jgi:hypothetical protein
MSNSVSLENDHVVLVFQSLFLSFSWSHHVSPHCEKDGAGRPLENPLRS